MIAMAEVSPVHADKWRSPGAFTRVDYCLLHSVTCTSPCYWLLLRTGMQQAGMRTDGLFAADRNKRTAVCSLMLDDAGDLISGVADMDIGQTVLYPDTNGGLAAMLEDESPVIVAFDGNIGSGQASELLTACEVHNGKGRSHNRTTLMTLFEPTSVAKSTIVLSHFAESRSSERQAISFTTPNAVELEHIHAAAVDRGLLVSLSPSTFSSNVPASVVEASTLAKARALVQAGIFATLLLKVGRHGVVTVDAERVRHHPIPADAVYHVHAGRIDRRRADGGPLGFQAAQGQRRIWLQERERLAPAAGI